MQDSELDNASEHVRYERDMLRFTAQWLLEHDTPGSETEELLRCAVSESFWIHARALAEFFGGRSSNKRDIRSTDFIDGAQVDTRRLNWDMMDKAVAHLSKKRMTADFSRTARETIEVLGDGLVALGEHDSRLHDEAFTEWLDAFKKAPSQEPHATSSHSRTIR